MNTAVATPVDVKLMNLAMVALLLVFVGLCAVAAVRSFSRMHAFDIQAITVAGDTRHNNSVTLRANVAPRIAGTFFTVDLAKVRAAFEAAPWVRRAVVHRDFPNRLRVTLQEHQPVALWGGEGETRLVNSFGEVFEANVGEVDQDGLPTLTGPEGQGPEVLTMYRALAPLFAAQDMTIEELELSGRGSWSVRLEAGTEIELGRGNTEEVVARVNRYLKTLTQVVSRYGRQPNAIESADLRHENGYAIRLRGVSTTEVAKK
ncbi:cell division protein FtsQ/DivIB [Rhodoferax sp. GW822-FHT02A01]|uniref:cell division protein FtsQ/DivIB n=1 Tax=Rhodoferax sp. GW822-FHT02A01 TaxID=3141537 RepID=UPI00315DA172